MNAIGLCQEALPRKDWPYEPDWIVKKVVPSKEGPRGYYPVWVIGLNTNDGRDFIWNLPLPLSWRYDMTNAEIDPALLEG